MDALIGTFCKVACCDEDCGGIEGLELRRCVGFTSGFVDSGEGFEVGEEVRIHFVLETVFTDTDDENDGFRIFV